MCLYLVFTPVVLGMFVYPPCYLYEWSIAIISMTYDNVCDPKTSLQAHLVEHCKIRNTHYVSHEHTPIIASNMLLLYTSVLVYLCVPVYTRIYFYTFTY